MIKPALKEAEKTISVQYEEISNLFVIVLCCFGLRHMAVSIALCASAYHLQ